MAAADVGSNPRAGKAALCALHPLLPPAPPDAPGPFALSYPGALDAPAERAGLIPTHDGYVEANRRET